MKYTLHFFNFIKIENNKLFDMNLKTLDFDKLSNLPYRLSIKNRLNNKLNSISICGWDWYNSIWNTELFKKIQHILENSEGKHIDEVFSKISKMIPNNFPYNNHYILTRTIRYDERIKYKYWDKETDVYGTLYINLNGIICRTKRKPYKYKRHYNRTEWLKQRKLKQKRKNIIDSTLIMLLNRPLLFEFYKKLLFDREAISRKIDGYIIWTNEPKQKNKRNYGQKSYYHIKIRECKKQLNKIQKDISSIELGDYTVFYNSNLYRYSIQKECHHFDQLIKDETNK